MSGYEAFLNLLMAVSGCALIFYAVRGWRVGEISFPLDRITVGPYRRNDQAVRFWVAILMSLSLAALCFWLIWTFWEQAN